MARIATRSSVTMRETLISQWASLFRPSNRDIDSNVRHSNLLTSNTTVSIDALKIWIWSHFCFFFFRVSNRFWKIFIATEFGILQLDTNFKIIETNLVFLFLICLLIFSGGLEIGSRAASARRVIVVLGPNALENVWTESNVAAVLKQLSSLSTRTIIISLKDLPNTTSIAKSSRRNGLATVSHCNDGIAFDRLTILRWQETTSSGDGSGIGGYQFWYKIRMSMPPKRPPMLRINVNSRCQSVGMIVQANGNKSNQQKARSRESLEVLVWELTQCFILLSCIRRSQFRSEPTFLLLTVPFANLAWVLFFSLMSISRQGPSE